jgi:hypothetical protein
MATVNSFHASSSSTATLLSGIFLAMAGFSLSAAVEIKDQGTSLRIEIDGELFSEYHYQNVPRPYFYPVLGPGSLPMTRNWPMKEAPDEEQDHPHHKSLWFTHGSVNGVDFWTDGANKGRIVHDSFTALESGPNAGVIRQKIKWNTPQGKTLLVEDRILRIQPRAADRFLDWEFTLRPVDGDVVLGDTKEGSMAIRLAETMRLKGKVGKGHIVNSRGVRDGDTWGKRAEWCDYYGPVRDQVVGVAVFDHPSNPRHPTWWHVRDYGLFAANPFGIHDFEKKPAGTGDLTVKAGESVTFRYRFYFHRGDEKVGQVEQQYREYVKGTKSPAN